jgi:hypothetical protein
MAVNNPTQNDKNQVDNNNQVVRFGNGCEEQPGNNP